MYAIKDPLLVDFKTSNIYVNIQYSVQTYLKKQWLTFYIEIEETLFQSPQVMLLS